MSEDADDRYLRLLKDTLTGAQEVDARGVTHHRRGVALLMALLASRGLMVVPRMPSMDGRYLGKTLRPPALWLLAQLLEHRGFGIVPDPLAGRGTPVGGFGLRSGLARVHLTEREFGLDWPTNAQTMIGQRRLENVEHCVRDVLARGVPGDLIEAGVWRGGTTILMRALLAQSGERDRRVWVADSFQGLPKPDPSAFPADAGVDYTACTQLAVSEQQVSDNFALYGLLDDQVRFLPGWFADTLHSAPIERLAVIRLDGDLYESTVDALQALYPRLSAGGYCIVDDYGALASCRQGVDDYRQANGITEELRPIDWTGAYWQRRA